MCLVCFAGGPIFRLKGSILTMSFLDCNGALIPYSYESWKDDSKDVSIYFQNMDYYFTVYTLLLFMRKLYPIFL